MRQILCQFNHFIILLFLFLYLLLKLCRLQLKWHLLLLLRSLYVGCLDRWNNTDRALVHTERRILVRRWLLQMHIIRHHIKIIARSNIKCMRTGWIASFDRVPHFNASDRKLHFLFRTSVFERLLFGYRLLLQGSFREDHHIVHAICRRVSYLKSFDRFIFLLWADYHICALLLQLI